MANSDFTRRVLAAVRRIPPGRVATYGDIAALAGSPRAWRAVGSIMRECRDPGVPCHRVIGSAGAIGGYSSLALKRELLRAEGLDLTSARVRRFAQVRWTPNEPSGPILRLHPRAARHDLPRPQPPGPGRATSRRRRTV